VLAASGPTRAAACDARSCYRDLHRANGLAQRGPDLALLAHVQQRKLAARQQQLAHSRWRDLARHARPARASRMSGCGGKISHLCSSGL
jgi:hypothetical protein